MSYKTCDHLHENGYFCQSAALKGRRFCVYHLRYRARRMRMAQARARHERWQLDLPPLEDMRAVQTAINHVVDALAADMIDPKRGQIILSGLRQAAANFRDPAAWLTPSVYANDRSQTHLSRYDELEEEFGLPEDIDLDAPPHLAFPEPTAKDDGNCHPERGLQSESKDPFLTSLACAPPIPSEPALPAPKELTPEDVALWRKLTTTAPETKPLPIEALNEVDTLYEITPEDVELIEVQNTEGTEAMLKRAREQEQNRRRRDQRLRRREARQRYAATARKRSVEAVARWLLDKYKLMPHDALPREAPPLSTTVPSQPEDSASDPLKKPPATEISPTEQPASTA